MRRPNHNIYWVISPWSYFLHLIGFFLRAELLFLIAAVRAAHPDTP